jgi:hypothetical protein
MLHCVTVDDVAYISEDHAVSIFIVTAHKHTM